MKFHKIAFYKIKRFIPLVGIVGATMITGCYKEDEIRTHTRTVTETKHDTVYAKPDTVYAPNDTIYLPGDTVYTPKDTVYTPKDTVYIPGDTVYTPKDTIYIPGDTVYTPSKPDTVYVDKTHNTTYVWGMDYWNEIWPTVTDNVARSADSATVNLVFLKNNGASMGVYTSSIINLLDVVRNSVSPQNRYKIHGSGTLNDVVISSQQCVQDSIRLAQMGFSFGRVEYRDFQR